MFNVRIAIKAVESFNVQGWMTAASVPLCSGSDPSRVAPESPVGLVNRLLAPPKSVIQRGLRICISRTFPGDAATAGPTAHVEMAVQRSQVLSAWGLGRGL